MSLWHKGPMEHEVTKYKNQEASCFDVFKVFLKLGLTSFGGPVAHLGYFRREFVEQRQWMNEHSYADLVALCQFLPGPASSQVGIAVGLSRAGIPGALAAWAGFTLPSAIILVFFAFGLHSLGDTGNAGWIHGLKIAAVAVVAHAILSMARVLTPDITRIAVALAAAATVVFLPTTGGQIGAIVMGGAAGYCLLRNDNDQPYVENPFLISRKFAGVCLSFFFILLFGLPLLAHVFPGKITSLFDIFYRAGSLVFGGGHVVLPLLQKGVMPFGWMTNDQFLAGYGAAQAVPGPLFTFAAYLGAVMGGWAGAGLCLVAIFLPSFLLVFGVLPFWAHLRMFKGVQSGLRGVNAAVVGILLAAFYNPVWMAGITSWMDFAVGAVAFLLLFGMKAPPWLVVALCLLTGFALYEWNPV